MLHIVLVEPEIPQNCGNVARTCAATGSQLHLIRPLGFDISEKAVRRAGLDYWNLVEVFDYENLEDFFRRRPEAERDLWLTTTKAPRSYQEARFTADSWLFFGKETAGLPLALRERYRDRRTAFRACWEPARWPGAEPRRAAPIPLGRPGCFCRARSGLALRGDGRG